MFDFSKSLFNRISVPKDARYIFVADLFVEDYVGGAELTSEALIETAPSPVFKLKSKDVTMELLSQNTDRFWIFGNFSQIDHNLIPSVIANLKYAVLEYDYKYCTYRSPELHMHMTNLPCDCHNKDIGMLISAFYHGASHVFWMSEKQSERYKTVFPFLNGDKNTILSSVFSSKTLDLIAALKEKGQSKRNNVLITLGSDSWVKGAQNAIDWCKWNLVRDGQTYETLWNLPYDKLLEKLSTSKTFVYLPNGADTCPRMVIEAKLLGCELILNDFVQHKEELWFKDSDVSSMDSYLRGRSGVFWDIVEACRNKKHAISGYITTLNCKKQEYPFEQSIQSMLMFCDEVCIVDGGSTDGTLETLESLAKTDDRVKVKSVVRNWKHPRFAVFDGAQKAEARAMCTSEFCWQMDSDEIIHEDDVEKIKLMVTTIPDDIDLVCLPVLEYWGGPNKIRVDVQPWKWRLSRNKPHITHGIPRELRMTDELGLYAREGTDGCDLIDSRTFERIPHVNFYSQNVESVRQAATRGDLKALSEYESWFNSVVETLPTVFHYSWYDLERKIRLYRGYWTAHWNSLYNKNAEDSAENNMMFDVAWADVSDEMISNRSAELKKIGGWIWHRKWDGSQTPHIQCKRKEPKSMLAQTSS